MKYKKYWVWLSMIFGTANRRLWEAMRFFSGAAEAFEELSSGRLSDKLNESELRNIRKITIEDACKHIESCEEKGIGIVGYEDEEYPPQLRHIFNPPAVLYYKGCISCLKGTRTVTSVGTRRAGNYSLYACRNVCGDLAKSGIVIVSGFAVGIDVTSNLAAAEANRPTACVLGCGVDVDYPRDNIKYREIILSSGGVFVSELPPGTPPSGRNFPKRNRILAGLGKATIVFEAAAKSGSLITAGMAMEQGREVFFLPPGDIFDLAFSGNIAFLRDGAVPLYSYKDVLDCFRIGGSIDEELRLEAVPGAAEISSFGVRELVKGKSSSGKKKSESIKIKEKKDSRRIKKNDSNKPKEEIEALKQLPADLTELQKKIMESIAEKRVHADVIAEELKVDGGELLSQLTELEIMGLVKGLPGKLFERT